MRECLGSIFWFLYVAENSEITYAWGSSTIFGEADKPSLRSEKAEEPSARVRFSIQDRSPSAPEQYIISHGVFILREINLIIWFIIKIVDYISREKSRKNVRLSFKSIKHF